MRELPATAGADGKTAGANGEDDSSRSAKKLRTGSLAGGLERADDAATPDKLGKVPRKPKRSTTATTLISTLRIPLARYLQLFEANPDTLLGLNINEVGFSEVGISTHCQDRGSERGGLRAHSRC